MKALDYTWTIADKREETPNVYTFSLTMDTPRPNFIAGQYLTIKLPGYNPVEGKAYSISSAPHEKHVTLSVKKIGNFSAEILAKEIGDTIITAAPYGFFYPEEDDVDTLVFLAGGIGITPCISIIDQLSSDKDNRLLHLFYSNQTVVDIVFHDRLLELANQNKNFAYHSYITRQEQVPAPHHQGRINVPEILGKIPREKSATFFICGGMHFTGDLWKALRASEVKAENIYTEGFF